MSGKYLVLPCTEVGIGHLLTVLLHCAYYAYRTDRTLALDMRRFHYTKTDRHVASPPLPRRRTAVPRQEMGRG
jgi:hypothetical protein